MRTKSQEEFDVGAIILLIAVIVFTVAWFVFS